MIIVIEIAACYTHIYAHKITHPQTPTSKTRKRSEINLSYSSVTLLSRLASYLKQTLHGCSIFLQQMTHCNENIWGSK